MKSGHMLFCALLLVVVVGLFAGGVGGAVFPLLVACMLMGVTMWMMMMRPRGQ